MKKIILLLMLSTGAKAQMPIKVMDTATGIQIIYGIGSNTTPFGTSTGVFYELTKGDYTWGMQSTYAQGMPVVMMYVHNNVTNTNQLVQCNPDNIGIRSKDGAGNESQLRIKAADGVSIIGPRHQDRYFLPSSPPTAPNQVPVSKNINGTWRLVWVSTSDTTVFR